MGDTDTLNRKEKILHAAMNLFRQKGYAGTSMRDLAKEAGIEAASLYSHIRSKEDLLRVICFDLADTFIKSQQAVADQNLPPDKHLYAAIKAHIKVLRTNADASSVFLHEWRFLSEPDFSRFKRLRSFYEQFFNHIIEQGVETGIIKPVDIRFTVRTIFSALNWTYGWYRFSRDADIGDKCDMLYDLIMRGIGVSKP